MLTTHVLSQSNALSGSWLPPKHQPHYSNFATPTLWNTINLQCHSGIGKSGANSTIIPPNSHMILDLTTNEGLTSLQSTNTKVFVNHVSHNHLEEPSTCNLYGLSSSYRHSFNILGILNNPEKVLGKVHQTSQTHCAYLAISFIHQVKHETHTI